MKVSDLVGARAIDLNVDIGEAFPFDRQLLEFASSANICCGSHAGSEELTVETIRRCEEQGVRIGVHPGYPDRATLGRRTMEVTEQREFLDSIFAQVRWFTSITRAAYLKPHGAFYTDTAIALPPGWESARREQPTVSAYESGGRFLADYPGIQSLTMILRITRLPLLGLPASAHAVIADRAATSFIREGFADRAYRPDGTLVPRGEPDALLTEVEAVEEQVRRLLPEVDSICLHGDTPDCLAYAERIYRTVVDAGYRVGDLC